jgi:hypothetical protein
MPVSSRGLKPILGLIVLLAGPCWGLGGRAEASFALGKSALAPERSPGSLGFEFQLVLNGDQPAEPEVPSSTSTNTARQPTPGMPGDSPHTPVPQRDLLLVPVDLSHGSSSTGSPSPGSGSGTGLTFILPVDFWILGNDPAGRLFLADERFHPPPFASRLFRPPRVV